MFKDIVLSIIKILLFSQCFLLFYNLAYYLILPFLLHASPALTTITGLESNIITLTNSNQPDSQLYISSLTSPFATIPKIALGTQYSIKRLLDFQDQTPTVIPHSTLPLRQSQNPVLSYHGKETHKNGKE
jgi:hypothetical protein